MKNCNKSGKILCLDYGKVRIGLAISDISRTIALPRKTITDKTTMQNKIVLLTPVIQENAVSLIVIGYPLFLNGEKSPLCEEVDIFSQLLMDALKIEVILWDERLSSMEADKILTKGNMSRKHKTTKIDSIAATLILQSFLNSPNIS